MRRYCDQCGAQINDDSEKFCSKCGASLPEIIIENNNSGFFNNKKIIIALLVVIIALFSMLILISGAVDFRTSPALDIETSSEMTNEDDFSVALTDGENIIEGAEIKVTFTNNQKDYEYSAKTNDEGIATVHPSVEVGDYDVVCEFEGNSKYSPVSATKEISVKQAEPDYQSFTYSHSFVDTDKNRDGYVVLSEMNIAHTPKNIQNRMLADSDDDRDGKLNHDEYYKFMYKLNYDRGSYGL